MPDSRIETGEESLKHKNRKEIRFHHVGIVVQTDTIKNLLINFIEIDEHSWHVDSQGVDVTFLPLGNAFLELIYPHGNKTIEKYIDRYGEGIHHFCFEVNDLDYWADKCDKKGFKVVSKDQRCFFIHPKSFGGILVEFVQYTEKDHMQVLTVMK